MGMLKVERIGGFAGFGGASSRLKSDGVVPFTALSPADQRKVEAMFNAKGAADASPMRDGFSYRITRATKAGDDVIEVPESAVPAALVACVKDRIG